MRAHLMKPDHGPMDPIFPPPALYTIRIHGHLGPTLLAAFPAMVPKQQGGDTVLTGLLPDRSALYGVLAEIEALGLDLIELHKLAP
jgi:monoterpene epsilon-lactone hydrolase